MLTAVAVAVVLHHWLIGPAVTNRSLAAFLVGVGIYGLASWALLYMLWNRLDGRLDIPFLLLILDVLACVAATYVTGAENSWLYFLIALRLFDPGIGMSRMLVLAHLAPLLYVGMVWYGQQFDGRPMALGAAAVKTFTLYGTALYFVLIGRVITALRTRTLSAIHVSRDLIAELEEKSARLAVSMEQANAANQAKTRFLATVSHELRTPLTAIIEHTEMVLEDADPATDAAVIHDLTEVVRASRQLAGTVDDLLDFSRIESERLTPYIERFDLGGLVEEVCAAAGKLADRDNNRLEVTCENDAGSMRTDRARLRQILMILLGNAAKFTSNGAIRLEVRRTHGDGTNELLAFRVSDTGIGITPEVQAALFTPFTQGDSSTTRKHGGTGLGLALAKRYAELISAHLSYETTIGVGTTFTLLVPPELSVETRTPIQ